MVRRTAEERPRYGYTQSVVGDYQLTVVGGQSLIDASRYQAEARVFNHGCSPNAQCVKILLRGSSFEITRVETICDIQANTEVLVSSVWVTGPGDTVVT